MIRKKVLLCIGQIVLSVVLTVAYNRELFAKKIAEEPVFLFYLFLLMTVGIFGINMFAETYRLKYRGMPKLKWSLVSTLTK